MCVEYSILASCVSNTLHWSYNTSLIFHGKWHTAHIYPRGDTHHSFFHVYMHTFMYTYLCVPLAFASRRAGRSGVTCDNWKIRERIVVINCQEVTKERMKEKKKITPHVPLCHISCLRTKQNWFSKTR